MERLLMNLQGEPGLDQSAIDAFREKTVELSEAGRAALLDLAGGGRSIHEVPPEKLEQVLELRREAADMRYVLKYGLGTSI